MVGLVSAAGESPARDGKFWGEDGKAVWCKGMGSGSGDGGCRRECSGLWRGVCVREEGRGGVREVRGLVWRFGEEKQRKGIL